MTSLLLAAQVVFNQLVSSDIACVHRDRMVHEELGIEFGNAGSDGNRPKCLTKGHCRIDGQWPFIDGTPVAFYWPRTPRLSWVGATIE